MSNEPFTIEAVVAAFEQESPDFLALFRQEYGARRGDGSYYSQFQSLAQIKALAEFAVRWQNDERPWARAQLLEYVRRPFDRPGHHAVVKRIYKHAERTGDDELIALFAVAFDRLIRRRRVKHWVWIREERRSETVEKLASPLNSIVAKRAAEIPSANGGVYLSIWAPQHGRLFYYATRHYLRRRVWRYLRRLARRRPEDYCSVAARALLEYRDDDLESGENLLDSRTLLQLMFRGRPEFDLSHADHVRLAPGASLAKLAPAPAFDELWSQPAAFESLWKMCTQASARLVRKCAVDLLTTRHAATLARLSPVKFLPLLAHHDEAVRLLGLTSLERSGAVGELSLESWFKLLDVQDPTILATICDLFAKNVDPAQLTLAQQVQIACRAPLPIAQLGATMLQQRTDWSSPDDRACLAKLADAECDAKSGELARWALDVVGGPETYSTDSVVPFFDSLHSPIREAAEAWLATSQRAGEDPVLWSRLLETPFDDVRRTLLAALSQHAERFAAHRDRLSLLWSSVLLNVHRGARKKPLAIKQLAEALADEPHRASEWLPVLATAVRSIRGPERRAGLAAVAFLAERRPDLQPQIARTFPELSLSPEREASS